MVWTLGKSGTRAIKYNLGKKLIVQHLIESEHKYKPYI